MRGLRGARLYDRLGVVSETCALGDYLPKQVRFLSKGRRRRRHPRRDPLYDPDVLILVSRAIDQNRSSRSRHLVRELGGRRP
ncbi:MAG: hypothetical protein R3F20_07980 [Planctomycetota bacterium]